MSGFFCRFLAGMTRRCSARARAYALSLGVPAGGGCLWPRIPVCVRVLGWGGLDPSAYSTRRQSALTSCISSMDWQRASRRRGEQTRTARHWAREMATFRRLREKRKARLRGTSSPLEVAIEKKTMGASWPWNLSTVPTRTPAGQARAQAVHLGVVGRDDHEVLVAERAGRAVGVGEGAAAHAGDQRRDLGHLLVGGGPVAVVVDRARTGCRCRRTWSGARPTRRSAAGPRRRSPR